MIKVYLKMFIRSFFLQALWNFERMQNIGFIYILKPFLDKVYLDDKSKQEALMRHAGYFNTHPYMANLLIAIVASLEKDKSENKEDAINISSIKNQMAGPLAAIGDSLFFGTLRPLVACFSILIMLLFMKFLDQNFQKYAIFVPIIFIITYNIFHIASRAWLMFIGFKFNRDSLSIISSVKILMPIIKYIGFFISTVALFVYLLIFKSSPISSLFFGSKENDLAIYIIVFLFSIVFNRFGVVFLIYSVIIICSLISYLRI
ncbi:MAG: PTS system mannose/fructose/sorbose family transporter subunit IID [Endomicrobium sp.]|jgi:mannose/fructose/N-acetylgalactosamine-specific phosphotransferase system component IID|uniref:PTS system mannose/fructose/sorbose family transporter subunit IID n=1 Tax=Candidatus Endomicrobiellum cubanum TaxID=3242325 RepID=UPI00281C36C2|nr:PTS system mannose/fructose/sorbose family transporter subunit IID [Endomicrobium sp.]